MPTAPQNENDAAVATIAVRSSTSAVASLSRLSPSRIATTRLDTDRLLDDRRGDGVGRADDRAEGDTPGEAESGDDQP